MATPFPQRPGPPAAAIEPIRKLFPPSFLVHVGAGSGTGPLAQWRQWDIDRVLVVDADARRLAWVEKQGRNWEKCGAVLAASDGPVAWYEASNADESGLVSAADLMGLWPSLTITQQQQQVAATLDTLLQEREADYAACWLFIECFPVLPILQGAPRLLEHTNVVWARVITTDLAAPHEATLAVIHARLAAQGFVLVDISASSHPSIGYALFVKNRTPQLEAHIAALRQDLAHRTAELAQAKVELDKAGAALEERDARLAALEAELAERGPRR